MKSSSKKLINVVYLLIALFIIAFLTGFLQDTKFEFVIYIFYFILFSVGVKLVLKTLKSELTGLFKWFLLSTGFFSTGYFVFFVYALMRNLLYGKGITDSMESVEGILYLNSLFFLIGVVGSVVMSKINKKI